MEAILKKVTLDRYRILYVLILFSFFSIYFKDYLDYLSYFLTLSLVGSVGVYYLYNRDLFEFYFSEFKAVFFIGSIFVSSILYNYELARSYLFLISVVCIYFIFNTLKYSKNEFVKVHNVTFIIYVILSALLYFDFIIIGREINAFPVNFLGMQFTTFYGFLGSTASIDSYSALTVLVNLIYNKKRSGYFLAFIALLITLGTFRATPFLVLFGPFVIAGVIKFFWKKTIILFNLFIFLSFAIPFVIQLIWENELLQVFLNIATTGRASLWSAMIAEYLSRDILQLLIGFGNTTSFEVEAWHEEIANPHSAYFTMLISYGGILFSFIYYFLTRKMLSNNWTQLVIIYAVLLAGISNGQLFSFAGMPLILWIVILTSHNKKYFFRNDYSGYLTRLRLKSLNFISF